MRAITVSAVVAFEVLDAVVGNSVRSELEPKMWYPCER